MENWCTNDICEEAKQLIFQMDWYEIKDAYSMYLIIQWPKKT